jgi:hypothetical protein
MKTLALVFSVLLYLQNGDTKFYKGNDYYTQQEGTKTVVYRHWEQIGVSNLPDRIQSQPAFEQRVAVYNNQAVKFVYNGEVESGK